LRDNKRILASTNRSELAEGGISSLEKIIKNSERKDVENKIMNVVNRLNPEWEKDSINREELKVESQIQIDKMLFLNNDGKTNKKGFSELLIKLVITGIRDNFYIVDGIKKLRMIFYFDEDGKFGYRPEKEDSIFHEIKDTKYIKMLRVIR
jgi:hypothetical protein